MELKDIQTLIKFVSQNAVDEVEINDKDFKLLIKKNPQQFFSAPSQSFVAPVNISTSESQPLSAIPVAVSESSSAKNLIEIKSPMVGTFYRAANPNSPIFVNVGDEVVPGKVVYIIEAMKLFNEIECEVKGKIVKVLVDNASPVEYDQPLFLVEPA